MRETLRAVAFAIAAASALGGSPSSGAAQNVESLARACAGALWEVHAEATSRCTDLALAARGLHQGMGLLVGVGGPVPVSPSTAGWRIHRAPRWVMDMGVPFGHFAYADPEDPSFRERKTLALAARFTTAAGLFEGFSPAPTVGGVGSVDVVGELRVLPIAGPRGRSGSVAVWGAGARVGVLRESFTLPGVTVSAMHRRGGSIRVGRPDGSGGEVRTQPQVTSLAAVAGKDMLELGFAGGVQWDRVRGPVQIATSIVTGNADEPAEIRSGRRALPLDRTTWFFGVNRTWVVAQVAAEAGWSPAASPRPDLEGTGGFDARGGSFTGSLSVRVTY